MQLSLYILIASVGLIGCGCSTETVQRGTYDTMQNVQQEQCRDPRIMECPPRQRYEEYQRQRNTMMPR